MDNLRCSGDILSCFFSESPEVASVSAGVSPSVRHVIIDESELTLLRTLHRALDDGVQMNRELRAELEQLILSLKNPLPAGHSSVHSLRTNGVTVAQPARTPGMAQAPRALGMAQAPRALSLTPSGSPVGGATAAQARGGPERRHTATGRLYLNISCIFCSYG